MSKRLTTSKTELQKQATQEPSDSLTTLQKEAVLASRGAKIREMTRPELEVKIITILSVALLNIGGKAVDKKELITLGFIIANNLLLNHPNVTIREVELAVDKGSLGDFGKEIGEVLMVTPKYVNQWVKAYLEYVKKDAIFKQLQYEASLEKEPEMTEDKKEVEIQRFLREDVAEKYVQSQKEGTLLIEDTYGAIYNIITKRGFWNPDNDYKRESYHSERLEFIKTARKGSWPKDEWNEFDLFITTDFELQLETESDEDFKARMKDRINNKFFVLCTTRAKAKMIHDHFTGMLAMDEDIYEFLQLNRPS
jgi:hypothetical protein